MFNLTARLWKGDNGGAGALPVEGRTTSVVLRLSAVIVLVAWVAGAYAQQLSWVGNTALNLTNAGALPTLGGFVEPSQTVSITTQTYPISAGQSVFLIYSTDHWNTQRTVQLSFDKNVGNNSQWFTVLGPLAADTDVLFYIEAESTNAAPVYDNNSTQNFGYISRFAPAVRRGAILQWFATPYSTILKRLPEVAQAGYAGIYLPPPQKSGGGGLSVGYNPFDRFDLGDRLQCGSVVTQYGSTEQLQQVITVAHRLGLEVYADLVTNHSDDRASTPIDLYPGLLPEDFHILSTANPTNSQIDFNNAPPMSFNLLNDDLAGLADIAHEDGNQSQTGPFNLGSFASFNSDGKPSYVRDPLTPQYYPGGAPVTEDVREYLKRWGWFLTTVFGFDGYRIDAVRETDPGFFNTVNSQGGYKVSRGNLLPYLYSLNPNLLIFGEDDNTSNYEQREYAKTGMDLLDFPFFNNVGSVYNSNGFGDIGSTFGNGYGIDSSTGLTFQDGGLANDIGVTFVQSHDYGPPTSNNLAYANALTRGGNSIVYFDGNNQQPGNYSQFPKPGRADALGFGDSILLPIVDARYRFGRGSTVTRFADANCLVYERQVNGSGILLVGSNLRGDLTSLTETVTTAFAPGTVLADLSGQEPNITIDPSGNATLTVPPNSTASNANNAQGYVLYAPIAPHSTTGVALYDPINKVNLVPATIPTPAGTYGGAGSYQAATLTSNKLSFTVGASADAATCYARLDNGYTPPGIGLQSGSPEGLVDGFFLVPGAAGSFSEGPLDLSGLVDGLHVLRVRVFTATTGPGVFQDFVTFFFINRGALAGVNGNLTKYGNPLVTQTRTPTSQSNRLDEMFVSNDDAYLYIGLAGNVSPAEGYTNGVVTFLDTEPGDGTGVVNFNSLKDDSGPAGRLLSNGQVTAPPGFGAKFGAACFRQTNLHSSPEAPFTGAAALPAPIGAQAGVWKLNPATPAFNTAVPSKMVWLPRSSPFGSATGLEVAIPLASLYPNVISHGQNLGLVSYLCTTGEAGTTLSAYDPLRGSLGGRPAPISYLTNQFLPPQTGIVSDPGAKNVQLTQSATYSLQFARPASGLMVTRQPSLGGSSTGFQVNALVKNPTSQTITGTFYVVLYVSPFQTVTNAPHTLTHPFAYYLTVPITTFLPNQSASVMFNVQVRGTLLTIPHLMLEQGPGIP
ncbi:MAG: alpha-amylase family protein [Fimbriimonadaceae bacterium]